MARIPAEELVQLFRDMYSEHWRYEWGAAEKGCVDCSGAFVYAFRTHGLTIPHGSNAIARKATTGGMLPTSQARPGMAAFKVRLPGEKGYDLPDKYKDGGDLADYYHIGLVDNDTRYVLNAKSTKAGFSRDKISDGWDCVARLKDVEYGDEGGDKPVEYGTVVLPSGGSGNTVNLREGPSRNDKIIEKVPVGSAVQVLEDKGTWCKVCRVGGKEGWMMSNYIEYSDQAGESDGLTDDELKALTRALTMMEDASDILTAFLSKREKG